MKKNWGEIKREIISLGFENEDIYESQKDIFLFGVNRAINLLALSVTPLCKTLEIKREEFLNSFIFNIKERDGEFYDFLSPACVSTQTQEPISYRILPNKRLYCQGEEDITLWYKRLPREITAATLESEEIDLPEEGVLLLPLLACFYIWQEDDERKAVTYRNDYENLKAKLLKEKGKAFVIKGREI